MSDLFKDKAQDWDERPIPAQISAGVFSAIAGRVALTPDLRVLDFGAGTGLVCGQLAPLVGHIVAVDISAAMLEKLAAKPALSGKVETVCQDLLVTPLDREFDLVVSAMAIHHVRDTAALFRTFAAHLPAGGRVALADLDTEDGDFHPPGTEGVFHAGFDRPDIEAGLHAAGFDEVAFTTAVDVVRDGKTYPVFLVTATKGAG